MSDVLAHTRRPRSRVVAGAAAAALLVAVETLALFPLSDVAAPPAFGAVRRAAIRLQAAHVTRGMIRELIAVPQTTAPRTPLFARLDALQERYAALGGDPADLVR